MSARKEAIKSKQRRKAQERATQKLVKEMMDPPRPKLLDYYDWLNRNFSTY